MSIFYSVGTPPPPCPNRNLKKSLVTNKNLKNKLLFLAMTVRPPEIFTFNSQLFANLSLHQFSVKINYNYSI